MTGLDRLHGIAEDVGRTVWLSDLGAALGDIADGIEGGTRDPSGYESDVLAWVEENGGLDAVKKRLMPEGMSWPRYESGEPVPLGGEVTVTVHNEDGDFDRTLAIRSIKYKDDGVLLEGTKNEMVILSHGERVKRPAPKVLDADGVEIRVGDECYVVSNGDGPYVVDHIREADGAIDMYWHENKNESLHIRPDLITHRAPVLAADEKPLEAGQTVWHVADGKKYTVEKLFEDGAMVTPDGITGGRCRADYLTHERPDSFSLIEQDAELTPYDYAMKYGKPDGVSNGKFQRVDLVRRAKALAGVSE